MTAPAPARDVSALADLAARYQQLLSPAARERRAREGAWAWSLLASIHIARQGAAETCDYTHLDRLIAGRDDRLATFGRPDRAFARDFLIPWGRFYRDTRPEMLPAWRKVWRDARTDVAA